MTQLKQSGKSVYVCVFVPRTDSSGLHPALCSSPFQELFFTAASHLSTTAQIPEQQTQTSCSTAPLFNLFTEAVESSAGCWVSREGVVDSLVLSLLINTTGLYLPLTSLTW